MWLIHIDFGTYRMYIDCMQTEQKLLHATCRRCDWERREDEYETYCRPDVLHDYPTPEGIAVSTRRAALRAWFESHPNAMYAYEFFDGRIIEESAYVASLTSRTARLVAIASDGFPALRSRYTVDLPAAVRKLQEDIAAGYAAAARIGAKSIVRFHGRRSIEQEQDQGEQELPPCVLAMGCYCAGHARGNPSSAACDTTE